MLYDRILIKYGELTLKGKNQKYFIQRITKTIKNKCKKFPKLEYINHHQRFYIILNGEDHNEVIKALDYVFGLHAYSLTAKCKTDLDEIKALALRIVQEEIKEKTIFKVETKRADKDFPLTSIETSKEVASYVLRNSSNLGVDVNNPEVILKVEIRNEGTFISTKEFLGLGGLPVGIDGSGLLMLSGGIDSPVAGFLTQKRGVALEVIHFASPPYTSLRAKQKVIDLAEKLSHYAANDEIKIYNIPFTKMQKAIYDNCPKSYTITIMRRMMYRIAEAIAKKNNTLIIINGENIGQVASQTLHSMSVINAVTSMPIIRPVVTMDKLEIIQIAKKIGTYDISIQPYEDCCTIFVPQNPVTKPDLDKCLEYEKTFDYEKMIEECVNEVEIININANQPIKLISDEDVSTLF